MAYWPAVAIGAGVAVAAWAAVTQTPHSSRALRRVIVGGLSLAAGLGLARWQLGRLFTEQPNYVVEGRREALEVRRYAPMVQAETLVEGTGFDEALDDGFRRLARYIFGGNRGHEQIPMTAPVTGAAVVSKSTRSRRGETFSMNGPIMSSWTDRGHTLAFNMPAGRDVHSLPQPLDPRVTFRQRPARRVAVLAFRGRFDAEHVREKQRELVTRVIEAGLTPRGEVLFAGYDPPSTLPPIRRNEVWVEVEG